MESGLSLDRLRALVEVGASGSIVQATAGDPVKQSQYSRQIKELEDFFRVELVERHGKGIRLTPNGRELARISRFFLLGLSNFQLGCLAEGTTFRIGASATFLQRFLIPTLTNPSQVHSSTKYFTEPISDTEIERRLHDLTLDFGIVSNPVISRPLQLKKLTSWQLLLWVPKVLSKSRVQVLKEFQAKRLPLVWSARELSWQSPALIPEYEPYLACASFLETKVAMEQQGIAALLPNYFKSDVNAMQFMHLAVPGLDSAYNYHLAWNPRLMRLNPHAVRQKDALVKLLT